MSTMTLDLPAAVRDEVSAAVEAGIYADEEAFVADAVRTLLAVPPDVQGPSPAGCMSVESIRWARRPVGPAWCRANEAGAAPTRSNALRPRRRKKSRRWPALHCAPPVNPIDIKEGTMAPTTDILIPVEELAHLPPQ